MGLDSRDYLRDESRRYGGGSSFGYSGGQNAPMCRRILIVTIAVFVAQILSVGDWSEQDLANRRDRLITQYERMQAEAGTSDDAIAEEVELLRNTPLRPELLGLPKRTSVVQNWLQMETPKVFSGQVWRLVTCAFCHDRMNLLHILFNMLFLWWFGPKLESMYGSKEFLVFYLTAAVVASISYIALDLVTGDPVPMVGASGAIMAVVTLFAMHYPSTVIYVMFVLPVEIRWIVLGYAIFDLHPVLLALSGEEGFDNVAHAAHLGGLALGYLYGKKGFRLPIHFRFADVVEEEKKRAQSCWRKQ